MSAGGRGEQERIRGRGGDLVNTLQAALAHSQVHESVSAAYWTQESSLPQ